MEYNFNKVRKPVPHASFVFNLASVCNTMYMEVRGQSILSFNHVSSRIRLSLLGEAEVFICWTMTVALP